MPNSGKDRGGLKGYTENIVQHAKDYVQSFSATTDYQDKARTYPPGAREAMAQKANESAAKNTKDLGQLAGAILQGRRYDSKGKRK